MRGRKKRMKMTEQKEHATATLDRDLWREVRIYAVRHDQSAQTIVEEAIREFLKKHGS